MPPARKKLAPFRASHDTQKTLRPGPSIDSKRMARKAAAPKTAASVARTDATAKAWHAANAVAGQDKSAPEFDWASQIIKNALTNLADQEGWSEDGGPSSAPAKKVPANLRPSTPMKTNLRPWTPTKTPAKKAPAKKAPAKKAPAKQPAEDAVDLPPLLPPLCANGVCASLFAELEYTGEILEQEYVLGQDQVARITMKENLPRHKTMATKRRWWTKVLGGDLSKGDLQVIDRSSWSTSLLPKIQQDEVFEFKKLTNEPCILHMFYQVRAPGYESIGKQRVSIVFQPPAGDPPFSPVDAKH